MFKTCLKNLSSDIRAKLIARLRNAPYIQTQSESNNLRANPDIKGGGGGGGGGVHPDFFVKLGFEIAVDQQTKTGDRTFEGVPDPNRQTVPAGQPRPYLVQIRPNVAKYPEHAQNHALGCSTCSYQSPEHTY